MLGVGARSRHCASNPQNVVPWPRSDMRVGGGHDAGLPAVDPCARERPRRTAPRVSSVHEDVAVIERLTVERISGDTESKFDLVRGPPPDHFQAVGDSSRPRAILPDWVACVPLDAEYAELPRAASVRTDDPQLKGVARRARAIRPRRTQAEDRGRNLPASDDSGIGSPDGNARGLHAPDGKKREEREQCLGRQRTVLRTGEKV